MKKQNAFIILLTLSFLIVACGDKNSSETNKSGDAAASVPLTLEERTKRVNILNIYYQPIEGWDAGSYSSFEIIKPKYEMVEKNKEFEYFTLSIGGRKITDVTDQLKVETDINTEYTLKELPTLLQEDIHTAIKHYYGFGSFSPDITVVDSVEVKLKDVTGFEYDALKAKMTLAGEGSDGSEAIHIQGYFFFSDQKLEKKTLEAFPSFLLMTSGMNEPTAIMKESLELILSTIKFMSVPIK